MEEREGVFFLLLLFFPVSSFLSDKTREVERGQCNNKRERERETLKVPRLDREREENDGARARNCLERAGREGGRLFISKLMSNSCSKSRLSRECDYCTEREAGKGVTDRHKGNILDF